MKCLVYKDSSISDKRLQAVLTPFTNNIKKYTDITPAFTVEQRFFNNYAYVFDNDYDVRPAPSLIAELTRGIGYTHDHVFMFVDEPNWLSAGEKFDAIQKKTGHNKKKGIWGTNYSYAGNSTHFHYCRFDTESVKALETMYHEWSHSLDSLCSTEVAININSLMESYLDREPLYRAYHNANGFRWDRDFVHGAHPAFAYIGRDPKRVMENVETLSVIAEPLQKAYAQRRKLESMTRKVSMLETIIKLQRKVRELLNRKNGVGRV